jgi:hypothetical protein
MLGKTRDKDPAYEFRISVCQCPNLVGTLTKNCGWDGNHRHDDEYPTPGWQTVLSGEGFQQACSAQQISTINNWKV